MPTVSVITATWQRHDTLLRAIKSVQQQVFTDWEHIIISDGKEAWGNLLFKRE